MSLVCGECEQQLLPASVASLLVFSTWELLRVSLLVHLNYSRVQY